MLAVWPSLSCPPSLPSPRACLFFSGPVSVLLVPPSGYLVVSTTVRLSYLWHGVSGLIGSCLHCASWQQRLRPCVGLCPLHHGVGVVHVPFAPALSYSPSGDPEFPSDSAKAAHACLLGLCGILPPSPAAFPGARSFLVCWLPLAFFFCGPCFGWSCLPASFFVVLVGAGGPLFFVGVFCFVGVACVLVCFVCVVLLCVVRLWLVSRFRFLLLLVSPTSF